MRRCTSIIVVTIVLFWGLAAWAQDDRAEKVDELAKAGAQAYREGRMIDAVEALKAADDLTDDPRVGFNYARTLEKAGFCTRALAKFESLTSGGVPDATVRKRAQEMVDGALECTPMGVVAVKCETPGARVTLGGQAALCGDVKRFPPSPVEWSASATGLETASGTVTPTEGETTTITIKLEERKAPVPVANTSSGKPWKLLAGGATTIAGAGLFVAGLVSDSTANTRSEQILDASSDGDIDRLNRLESAADTARTRSLALTISGVTLAAIGGGLLFWHFSDSSERSLTIAPAVGPENASVTARYRW